MINSITGADHAGKRVTVRAVRPFRHGDGWAKPGDEVECDYVSARALVHGGKAEFIAEEAGFVEDADVPPAKSRKERKP
jgi:hypothetical protein